MILRRLAPLALAIPLLAPAAAGAQSTTAFAQLTGATGCLVSNAFEEDVPGGCGKAPGLSGPLAVAVAPDGGQVYVGTADSGGTGDGTSGIAVFRRDAGTGGVTFASCVTDDGGDGRPGSEGLCADGDALRSVDGLAFSPDGASLYAASPGSSGVSWFAREPATGALTQEGCVKTLVRAGERCASANALAGASDVAVAPDGAHVYVAASRSAAVAVFKREQSTGALTYQSCASESGSDGACTRAAGLRQAQTVAPTADGKALYVLGQDDVAVLSVDPATGDLAGAGCLLADAPAGGPCTDVPLLDEIKAAAVSPDGRSLLVTAGDATVLTFSRDPRTGALTQQQCIVGQEFAGDAQDSAADGCTEAAFDAAGDVAISPDGRAVFVAGEQDLGAFRRDPATGALTQFACLNDIDDGSDTRCGSAHGIEFSSALAGSADGRNLYVVSQADSLSVLQVSVAVTSRVLRAHAGRAGVALACPALRREGCAGDVNGARFKLAAGRSGSVRVRTGRRRNVLLTVRMKGLAATRKRLPVQFHGRAARVAQ